ncbi:hypothetical protein J4447_03580 [Candidatus Pacearchaeota archaeon]|nr:hypothetical protein [Candidatus Pacearchaeota archaeon]
MEKEVVSNTSSVIFLAKLDIFNLAKNIFSKIIIPTEVADELFKKNSPENERIKRELNNFLIEKKVEKIKDLPLGGGERAAISLCLEREIKMFLSDDKKARVYARSLGLRSIGILGIILINLRDKKISKKEFIRLLNEWIRKGYYISPLLYAEILKEIEEF